MLRKLASSALAIALAIAGLVATNTPAQAAGTGDQGSIYYIGSWIGADWQGIRRYDLATGDDMRLDLDSPTCSGLAGSSTSGLAVDLAHKRLYWTATDGTAGVFAMDLSIGKCYALELDTSPRGIAISDDGETLNWTDRVYDPAQGIYCLLYTSDAADD